MQNGPAPGFALYPALVISYFGDPVFQPASERAAALNEKGRLEMGSPQDYEPHSMEAAWSPDQGTPPTPVIFIALHLYGESILLFQCKVVRRPEFNEREGVGKLAPTGEKPEDAGKREAMAMCLLETEKGVAATPLHGP